MLIFNSSVSEEYLKLYQAKCLTAEELDDIRLGQNSLKIISYDGSQDVIDFYQRMVKFSFEQNNIEDTDACMEEIEDKANKLSDFEKGNGLLLLCYLKERLIATISYAKPNELLLELSDKDLSDYHELGTVFIDPEYQGFGFLSYLIEQLKNKLEAAGIKKICFDCGYDLAQQVWTHKYGKADDIFADYWSKDSHHMIWYTTIDQL
jgi:GNAT superfamily N-acetyltransferase